MGCPRHSLETWKWLRVFHMRFSLDNRQHGGTMYRIAIVDDSEINLTLLSALVKKLDACEPQLFSESQNGLAWCSEKCT